MASDAMGDGVRFERVQQRRRGAGDIAVEHDGNALSPRRQDRPHHAGDLAAAQPAQNFQRIAQERPV